MSGKPIFCCTHPRACSTAFERVFMQRRDILNCAHEPFGDVYYYGPERMALRFEDDATTREESGYSDITYGAIMDQVMRDNYISGKRLFIKDMAQYFVPPNDLPASIAPSLLNYRKRPSVQASIQTNGSVNGNHVPNGDTDFLGASGNTTKVKGAPFDTTTEAGNPTVAPRALLEQFHFAFLIRHPRRSIPSYYRCTIPPLNHMTGFIGFRPDEAGYVETRRLFDYLRETGQIGPGVAGQAQHPGSNHEGTLTPEGAPKNDICVIDADDLLDDPEGIIEAFCASVGIDYSSDMLKWNDPSSQQQAKAAFEKWKGFHEDALRSNDLKPRARKKRRTDEEVYAEWVEWWGKDAAEMIKKTVDANTADYEYLRQFRIRTPALVKRFEEEGY